VMFMSLMLHFQRFAASPINSSILGNSIEALDAVGAESTVYSRGVEVAEDAATMERSCSGPELHINLRNLTLVGGEHKVTICSAWESYR
jgi:hypothetical protein